MGPKAFNLTRNLLKSTTNTTTRVLNTAARTMKIGIAPTSGNTGAAKYLRAAYFHRILTDAERTTMKDFLAAEALAIGSGIVV